MKILEHIAEGWCHLCGKRRPGLAGVWYSKNAEHDPKGCQKYIRICSLCAGRIEQVASRAVNKKA